MNQIQPVLLLTCSHSQAAFHSQCFQLGGESMAVEENFNPSMQQPPSAPEWIKDLILALIDRFGDRENELS